MIKGNFSHFKTNEPKSSSYHKLVQSQCGDDNVQSGNGQNIIRVDPCLKLFVGCPIMVSVNDFKKNGVVKGTTGKFKGVVLKENKERKVEIWNGTFVLPTKSFDVTVKFPIGHGRWFLKLARSKIMQFPINNDLATTGHK